MELFLWWQKDLNASIIWIQTFKYFWILLQHHLYCFFFLNSNTAFNMNGNSNVLNKLKKNKKKNHGLCWNKKYIRIYIKNCLNLLVQ